MYSYSKRKILFFFEEITFLSEEHIHIIWENAKHCTRKPFKASRKREKS